MRVLRLAFFGVAVIAHAACFDEGNEGDRCNPLRTSNECTGGLVCAGNPIGQSANYPIPFCAENYCCPLHTLADGRVQVGGMPGDSVYCEPGCGGSAQAECNAGNVDACAFISPDASTTPQPGAPDASPQ